MLVILLFIIILNIVSIVLMYYCLADLTKKEKLIYIAAGTALMYILTTIVYWISTRGIEMTEVSEMGKNLITFLFVPINGIIILPLFAKSYYNYKMGGLDGSVLKKRAMVLGVILLIILIIECIYFKNIQEQVVNLINEQRAADAAQEAEQPQLPNGITGIYITEGNEIEGNELGVENQVVVNDTEGNNLSASSSDDNTVENNADENTTENEVSHDNVTKTSDDTEELVNVQID